MRARIEEGSIWVHRKSGRGYRLVGLSTECTNARAGQLVVIYEPVAGDKVWYSRDFEEFLAKFDILDGMQSIANIVESEGGEHD